jgi:hypothetical protein
MINLVRFINFSTFRATNKKTGGIKQRLLSAAVCDAPIAQLDRALPSEGRGRGFEFLWVHHFFFCFPSSEVSAAEHLW